MKRSLSMGAGTAPASASAHAPTSWKHEYWSSRFAFVLAASGSAVGLGNIWKFPYITGEYGGGAFVLVYLVCIAVIGIPVMMAEVLIGRRGGESPVGSMRHLAREERRSPLWQVAGWTGVLGSFIILSFYSVIGGWALAYTWFAIDGQFGAAAATGDAAAGNVKAIFDGLLASTGSLIGWHTAFMAVTMAIVAGGVKGGLERGAMVLMPSLFLLLIVLVGYVALTSGAFGQGVSFLFNFDTSKLTWEAVLVALGHAFFSLSLGMAIMVAYGSYLPQKVSIGQAAIIISILDTTVALLAGLCIFPIVFSMGLEPGAGPGLLFVTLPLAFGEMPGGGAIFGTLFFVFVIFAALTSSISLLEPTVESLQQRGVPRPVGVAIGGLLIWGLGIASALSFNAWADIKLLDMSIFDFLDFVTANIMLPLTALMLAVFAGWAMSRASTVDELQTTDGGWYRVWRFAIRYVSPVAILVVFVYNLAT